MKTMKNYFKQYRIFPIILLLALFSLTIAPTDVSASYLPIWGDGPMPVYIVETPTPQPNYGWRQNPSGWWYNNGDGTCPASTWKFLDQHWYYFNDYGYMAVGWQKVGETWYYLTSSGAMLTGWLNLNNTWYYCDSSGAMKTGWQSIDNGQYYFAASGEMYANTVTPDGYLVDEYGNRK